MALALCCLSVTAFCAFPFGLVAYEFCPQHPGADIHADNHHAILL